MARWHLARRIGQWIVQGGNMEDVGLGVVTAMLGEAGNGINDAFRARVTLASGQTCKAYVKILGWREILVECVCASLGREAGMPIPEPLIVKIPEELGGPLYGFAAKALPFPDFAHKFEADVPGGFRLLQQWSQLIPAACFDEWIVNVDRNQGNLLYAGANDFWLIDHGFALAQGLADDVQCHPNQLFKLAVDGADEDRRSSTLLPQTRGTMQSYGGIDISISACTNLHVLAAIPDFAAVLGYLRARQLHLGVLGANQIPRKQGDMIDEQSR